ncbi:hypothetical protein JCM12296A_42720 [Desulfosarcina cetonica]|uniref:ferritin family protein n=1 Tax=Desulfosarcina cetonica TaxID=90730 RepID=UPI0006D0FEF0|nr:ferritin family protein [Desulfosarcina cetonica]
MFTAHDILDIAIRLEENGEKTYREARRHTPDASLAALLTWMAQEEHNHARWFNRLKERLTEDEDSPLLAEFSRALAEDVVQGQSFSLQEVDLATIDTREKMIRTFIGFEGDTIAFYETLGSFIDDPVVAEQLGQIVAEERNHIAQLQRLLSSEPPSP